MNKESLHLLLFSRKVKNAIYTANIPILLILGFHPFSVLRHKIFIMGFRADFKKKYFFVFIVVLLGFRCFSFL